MSMVKAQPNAKLLEDLDESSSFLNLLEQFWKSQKTGGIKIISIYETMPTPTVEVGLPKPILNVVPKITPLRRRHRAGNEAAERL
jgi:hypothetical protein